MGHVGKLILAPAHHILFFGFVAWSVAIGGDTAICQERVRHVLLLYPYGASLPATTRAGEAIRKRLTERSKERVEIYTDFLDLLHFPSEEHGLRAARYLAEKYAQTSLDIVMTINTESQRFATKYREVFAPNVPIVFCCVTRALIDATVDRQNDITGIVSEYDITKTLELALRLQPESKNLVFIAGASEIDRRWFETFRRQLGPIEKRLETTYLVGLPHSELLRRVSQLPRNTIVLLGTIFADGAGRRFIPAEAGGEIANAASVPIYTPFEPYIGHGVLGGYSDTFESVGAEAADLALNILDGADPRSIVPRSSQNLQFRVDAKQLQRWSLSESRLPAGTIVYFKDPSIWEQHRNLLIGVTAVIIIQAFLITSLLIQFQRRKRAENAMQVAQSELARVARLTTMGELAASIAHEVNQPLAAIVANSNAAVRWLAKETPNLDEAKAALKRIVGDGHRASDVISTIRAMLKKSTPAKTSVDVNHLIREVLALVHNELEKNGISVRTSFGENIPTLAADRVLVPAGGAKSSHECDRGHGLCYRQGPDVDGTIRIARAWGGLDWNGGFRARRRPRRCGPHLRSFLHYQV